MSAHFSKFNDRPDLKKVHQFLQRLSTSDIHPILSFFDWSLGIYQEPGFLPDVFRFSDQFGMAVAKCHPKVRPLKKGVLHLMLLHKMLRK